MQFKPQHLSNGFEILFRLRVIFALSKNAHVSEAFEFSRRSVDLVATPHTVTVEGVTKIPVSIEEKGGGVKKTEFSLFLSCEN